MGENAVVSLNQDIGRHLLTFLDGTNATNFLEAVNNSKQFWSIAPTSDHSFWQSLTMLYGHKRVLLCRTWFQRYQDEYDIDENHLVLISKRYSFVIQPSLRLFVHPSFSVEGFQKLAVVYKTPLFECYSRLLPFNTFAYCADYGLLKYESYRHTIGSGRILNDHEKKLFKENTYFNTKDNQNRRTAMAFVRSLDEFQHNLATRFSSNMWLPAINFSKLVIAGGCVVNALCDAPFPDTKEEDINLIYSLDNWIDFEETVTSAILKLKEMYEENLVTHVQVEKHPGVARYDVILPCGVRLNFLFEPARNSKFPLSHTLHHFDFDICQVAYNGEEILATFSFLQALATKTFIVYTMHAEIEKNVCTRIQKYCNRGFQLLEPLNFDGDFHMLMAQDDVPLYRVERCQYIDDDGEVHIATREYQRIPVHNVDTFRLQEAFISAVCPQLLDYE